MNILIKISGDLVENQNAIDFIRARYSNPDTPSITVIVGGRTQINEALEKKGITSEFRDGIRIHKTVDSSLTAKFALGETRNTVAKQLPKRGEAHFEIISPYLDLIYARCHFDADDYLRLLAPNFDEAYCLTLKGRAKDFPSMIKVVEFE